MSGIVGFVRRDGAPAVAADLAGALRSLAPRGPDGARIWCEGPVALGCAQLRATPQSSHETLPLADPAAGLAVVHDARLDNRDELHRRLDLARPLPETGDGELILAAWRQWGERCPEHLLGDFTFAVWDGRSRSLLLARDHAGMRLLYVFESPRLLAFASEIKALTALPGVPRRVDPARVADYMLGVVCDRTITFHAGIARLLPAHTLLAAAEVSRTRRYYRLALPDRVHPGTAEDVAAGFRAVLQSAVEARLAARGTAGSMLSGGLDSSALVCLARSLQQRGGGGPLPTFSLLFPRTPGADETPFIRSLVDQGGLEPSYIDADAISPLRDLDDMLAAADEPFHGAPFAYQWATYRAARDRGVGVLLDGNGGDAVVCHGYYFLADLLRRGRLLRLAREAAGLSRAYSLGRAEIVQRFAVLPSIPPILRRLRRAVTGGEPALPASAFVAPELAARVRLRERFTAYWHHDPPPNGDRTYHLANVAESLPKDGLEKAAAAFAVDQRCPFYDVRVIEYCLAVPSGQKIEHGLTRMLTRRALHDLLPPLVARRIGKASPVASLARELLGADRTRLEELVLGPASDRFAAYLDLAALRSAARRLLSGGAGARAAAPGVGQWHEIDQVRKAAVLLRWLQSPGLEG